MIPKELKLLENLAKEIIAERNEAVVLQRLADELVRSYNFSFAAVSRYDEARNGFLLLGISPLGKLLKLAQRTFGIRLQKGSFYPVKKEYPALGHLRKGKAWVGSDIGELLKPFTTARKAKLFQKSARVRSVYNAPLMSGRKILGTILIANSRETFSKEELSFLDTVSRQAALIIRQARLSSDKREAAERYRLLGQIDKQILEQKDPPRVVQAIVQNVHKVIPCDLAGVYLYDKQRKMFIPGFMWPDSPFAKSLMTFEIPLGKGIIGNIAKTRKAEIVNGAHLDKRSVYPPGFTPKSENLICVPFTAKRELLGVMNITRLGAEKFVEGDLEVARLFAEKSALAIENAQLLREHREREEQLRSLQSISTQITTSLILNTVLNSIITEAVKLIPQAQKGSILLVDETEKGLSIAATYGYAKELKDNLRLRLNEGYAGQAIKAKHGVLIDDVRKSPKLSPEAKARLGLEIKSAVVVPLILKGEVIGAISLDNVKEYGAFTRKEMSQLEVFASNAALAYGNARLHASVEREVRKIRLLNQIKSLSRKRYSLAEFMDRIARLIVESYHFGLAAIFLADVQGRTIRSVAFAGKYGEKLKPGYQQSFDEGIVGWVARTRLPRVSNDVSKDPFYIDPYKIHMKSELCVPILQSSGELLGCVNIESERLHSFTETDLHSMDAVAAEIAGAFEEHRLLEALRKSEEQYRTLVEAATDLVIVTDKTGRFIFVNRRFTEVTGYEPNEVFGREFDFVLHPDDLPLVRERFMRRMKGENIVPRYRFRIVTKNGEIRTIDYSVSTIFEQDAIRGVLGIGRDITEEEELQRKLYESEKNFRSLFERIKDAIYITTPGGEIIDFNQAAVDLFGYDSKEEMIQTHSARDLYADARDREEVVRILEEQGYLKEYEVRLRRRNGQVVIGLLTTTALRDAAGKVHSYQGIIRDVTKQREFERALVESEEKYRSLVEESLVGVYIIQDGKFQFVNERLANIFGYSVDEVVKNLKVEDLVAPEDRTLVQENIRKRVEGEVRSLRYGFLGIRKDLERIDIEVFGTRSTYQGKPAVIGTLLDLTQEKRSEREILEWRQRYDLIVASSAQVVYEYDVTSGAIVWSGSIENVLGYTLEEMSGGIQQWTDTIHPADAPEALRLLEEAERTLSAYDVEYRFKKKDGSYICMHDRGFFIPGESGKGVRMLGMMRDINSQKELERRVKSSELKYRLLFEHANDAILLMKGETCIDCNPRALEMFACRRNEILGQTLYSFSPPRQPDGSSSREAILQKIRQAESGIPQQFSWRNIKLNGSPFYAEVRLNRLEIQGESLVQAQVRDISAEVESQEELARSEENYRMLVREAAEAILVSDGDGNFVEVNDRACSLFGYSREEFLRMNIGSLAADPDGNAVASYRKFYARLIEEGNIVTADRFFRRKDGTIFPYEINAVLLANGMMQAILRDITERKKSDQELDQIYAIAASLHGEELFDRAASAIAHLLKMQYVSIAELDEGRTSMTAHTFYQKGKLHHDVRHSLESTPCREIVRTNAECLYAEGAHRFFGNNSLMGTSRIESFIGIPMFDGRRDLLGVVSAFDENVHHFTEHEKKLLLIIAQRLASEIETFAQQERERKLSHQLLHSQKMESLGTLAGGVAHDFNNILTGVLGYTSLLKKEIDPSMKHYHYLSAVEKSAQRAASLSRQLLTFVHRTHAEVKTLYMNDIVTETVHILEGPFPKSVSIQVELAPDLPMIEGDISQLSQVMMNLCINARDAMTGRPDGPDGGTLQITTSFVKVEEGTLKPSLPVAPGEYVSVCFSDTGGGISPEIQRRIFEPFFTTKERGKGTGLGLSVVYGILQNHGGFIDVKSEVGKGSAFTIFIPVSKKEGPQKEEAEPEFEQQVPQGNGETVFVVDDESVLRDLAKEILTRRGYEVLTASNGMEALDVYQIHRNDIQLVILDMLMPEMDGTRTFAALRELDPSMKILLLSGYSHGETLQALIDNGASGVVLKPFSPEELAMKVASILRN